MRRAWTFALCGACFASVSLAQYSAAFIPFLAHLNQNNQVASTVPGNGDVNPYGVSVVPRTVGDLIQNNILVSNFNDSANLQGTGNTIVQVSPAGSMHVFAHISPDSVPGCVGGVGLTTALAVLSSGWVIVGSLPTSNGVCHRTGRLPHRVRQFR